MAKSPSNQSLSQPSPDQHMKVLEAFRSVAVRFEKDLLGCGAREVALLLGAARQAAEQALAAAEERSSRGGPSS